LKLLDIINSPSDLRKLPVEDLPKLAQEIRDFMIENVSRTGGHLAPSLGTVELTLALHYAFNTPQDQIVWDVGHQAYAHKIITGRRDKLPTLRQYGGLSGFPRRSESEYDPASVGHASTSISIALGMATARDLQREKYAVIAVIGDGSLSGGLAFEGLNNLGSASTPVTIILNDNEMSISRNVGALSRYLTRVITDKRYNKLKSEIWELLGNLSNVGRGIRNMVSSIDDSLKHFLLPGKLFEDMGIRYIGPIDGHNIAQLIEITRFTQSSTTPVMVHVLTKKGKGYSFAEDDATKYHGISRFSVSTGTVVKSPNAAPSYSEVFGHTIIELARQRPEIVAITAAMADGTRLTDFRREFPNRFFDVGIAEEHAVTFAAGLALKGLRPVVAIYSTFLQRAYDQIVHDVALDNLNVVFCIDRAGLVGDDGPTHHGMFDLSYLRTIPNVLVMAPSDESELRNMIYTAFQYTKGPVFIRYPRGCGPGAPANEPFREIPIGTPVVLKKGRECALVSVGNFLPTATEVCNRLESTGISTSLIDARFVKPLDNDFYRTLFEGHQFVVTLENNSLSGGFGSSVLELSSTLDLETLPRIIRFGLPDAFIMHGDIKTLIKELELDVESIHNRILSAIQSIMDKSFVRRR